MESLARIPFLRDWPDSHRDLRFATCFRNRSSTFVLARQRYFKRPRPGGMEMRAILDLGAGGTALFTFQLTCMAHSRTSNNSLVAPARLQSKRFSRLSSVLETLAIFAVISWIAGKEDRQVIWKTIPLPEPRYAGLSVAIPIGIAVLLSTGQYLFDRAQWSAHNFGNMDPPQFGSYFTLPDPWLLLLFFPALFEEMIFRGLLQRRSVQRYGTYRGIFFVGIVWAAFHFSSDFAFARVTDQQTILNLASRIFTCLALSYVLGWL